MVKTKIFAVLTGILFSLCLSYAIAEEPIRQPQIIPYKCVPTPTIKVNFPPTDEIGKTNNLWRKTGLAMPAVGRPIYIHGVVLDENCVPVPGAVVQIWQGDAEGILAVGKRGKEDLAPYFAGSGTTYTDNLGEYSFITIFPGSKDEEIPFIRVRVKERDFKTLNTKMYFGDIANDDDGDYAELSEKERALVTAVTDPNGLKKEKEPITYFYNITLLGKAAYKEY